MPKSETAAGVNLSGHTIEARFSTDYFNPHKMRLRSLHYENNSRTNRSLTAIGRIRDSLLTTQSSHEPRKARDILTGAQSMISHTQELVRERKHHNLEHKDIEHTLGAFAAAAQETIGLSPYDAQLRASLAQIEGGLSGEKVIIEMNTGEGKTLVGAMTATTLALEGHPVHIATSNDVLAVRDMLEMGPVYHALGLQVGVVLSAQGTNEIQYIYDPSAPNNLRTVPRSEAYQADIVYAKASELGFDYERDHRELFPDSLRQRGFGYCIVDEIDDVLDQSQIPLIMEGLNSERFVMAVRTAEKDGIPAVETTFSRDDTITKKNTEVYTEQRMHRTFAAVFDHMREGIDYKLDETGTDVQLLDPDDEKFQQHLGTIPLDHQQPPYGRARLELILRGETLPGEDRPVLNTPLLASNEGIYGPPATAEDRSDEGILLKAARDQLEIHHMDAQTIANQTVKSSILSYYMNSAMQARLLFSGRYVIEPKKDPETEATIIDPSTKKEIWEIIPVDENTHRPTPGTRLMKGISSAIEALERRRHPEHHIVINPDISPASTITYPEYFSMYKRVTGMTATAIVPDSPVNIARELCRTFAVDDIIHISSQFPAGERKDDSTRRLFENWEDKHAYIAQRVVAMHANPHISKREEQTPIVQPILIGAESGEEAERIAAAIKTAITKAAASGEIAGFDVEKQLQILHAENTLAELDVIANAGRNGMITITSMFGRGTDIRLGGDRKQERDGSYSWEDERTDVIQAGGLHLIANEDDPRRLRQFLGRGGRQQDPRSSERVASLQDRAIREGFTGDELTAVQESARWAKEHWPPEDPEIPHIYDLPGSEAATLMISDAINNRTTQMAESRQYVNALHTVDNSQRLAWYHDRMELLTGKGLEKQLYKFARQHRNEFPQLRELPPRFSVRRLFDRKHPNLKTVVHNAVASFGEQQKAMLLLGIDAEWEAYLEVLEKLREGIHLQRYQNSSRPQENNRDLVEDFAVAASTYHQEMQQRVRNMVVRSIFGKAKTS